MTRILVTLASVFALAATMPSTLVQAQSSKPVTGIAFVTEQPPGEWLAHVMFGAIVQNASGEVIGDVNDLIFNSSGQISTIVLGIGGTLGIGEKNVGVPTKMTMKTAFVAAAPHPRRYRPERGSPLRFSGRAGTFRSAGDWTAGLLGLGMCFRRDTER